MTDKSDRRAFEVWAPRATRVELEIHGGRVAMEAPADGYYRVEAEARPGDDYMFVIDGNARPDPRSQWQPHGVHGASRVVDHAAFEWTDRSWQGSGLSQALVYELHVGTFTPEGTFDAAIAKLGYLADLGVTMIELMPVAQFPGARGWGYDGVDLYAPHHGYGGPDGLKRLVDACHAAGLGVIVDVVYNHLGPSGNHLGAFGPYFTDRYSTPWGQAVNFDGSASDHVRSFFIQNALMWLRDYHCDGLRLDAVHAILDTSAIHILEEIQEHVALLAARSNRSMALIAESDLNDPRVVRAPELGGYGMDAQWSDDLHHALHAALTGERTGYYADFGKIADIAKALRHGYVYDGVSSSFRGRRHGRPAGDISGRRFLGYLQTHDQIGNRAQGDRSSALMSAGLLKVGAALVLTSPFTPMLFQGEEWGASTPFLYFTDHEDPALGRAVSEGRRREFASFGWAPEEVPDPQDPGTFERSRLDWSEIDRSPHRELLQWHKELIRFRRAEPALSDGRRDLVRTRLDENALWLVVERDPVTVVCNLSAAEVTVPLSAERTVRIALTSSTTPAIFPGEVTLPPESVTIFTA
ncbi:MAG: malto-oligosyltrehalose trehalohydrolase [Actinomycetota bacterium]|nr:malto-oligosyltrehalose trehalohydrolase [Actinomycetota bacterium]